MTLPLLILASVMVLRNFGLLPNPIVEIGFGLGIAVAMAALARGVAIGLFAPGRPARRLFAMSEQAAESYASHLIWTARAFTFAIFLNVLHRATEAPASIHIATLDLLAVAVSVITVHLLWRSAQADFRPDRGEAAEHRLAWFRAIIWLIVAAIAAALATGYVGLAVFVAGRIVTAIVVGGAVIILVAFIDSLFAEVLASDSPYGRTLAAAFGLTPRGLDLAGTLISALLRLVLIVLAATVVLGFSGLFAEDLFGIFERATWNYVIGGFSFSLGAFLTAIAFLAIGTLAIRGAQRWLQTKFLPRTGLDAGLQNSILALFGYAAFIGVLALSLGALGIDLQKIAIIAGALSVGIGFGLQSIVANFVSGSDFAGGAADSGRRLGRCPERGRLCAPHQRAGHRDRDLRPRKRHHPQPAIHHRHGQELDPWQHHRAHHHQGPGRLRQRCRTSAPNPARHGRRAPRCCKTPPPSVC